MEHGRRRDPGWRDSLINNQIFIDHFLWTSHHESEKKKKKKRKKKGKFNTACTLKEFTKLKEIGIKQIKSQSKAEVSCPKYIRSS